MTDTTLAVNTPDVNLGDAKTKPIQLHKSDTQDVHEIEQKRPRGNRRSVTLDHMLKICDLIKVGMSYENACAKAGIRRSTFHNWLAKGEQKNARAKYVKFVDEVYKANAEVEFQLLKQIQDAKEWQAKAWILERRFPERWGRKDRIEHTGKDGKELKVIVDVNFIGGSPEDSAA